MSERPLDLRSHELTAVPREAYELSWLTKLDISGNTIVALPGDIARLEALEELVLAFNRGIAVSPAISPRSLRSGPLSPPASFGVPPDPPPASARA